MGAATVMRGDASDRVLDRAMGIRALLEVPEGRRDRLWRRLFSRFEKQLLVDTRDSTEVALVGWMAFAWLSVDDEDQGRHLYGSREHLGELVHRSQFAVKRHVRRLVALGWIEEFNHFVVQQTGGLQQFRQRANSYRAGARLRAALEPVDQGAQR